MVKLHSQRSFEYPEELREAELKIYKENKEIITA